MKLFSVLFLYSTFLLFSCNAHAQENYKQYIKRSYTEIDSLMYIQYAKSNFDGAISLMRAGQEKAKEEFGEQDSLFALYRANLGFFYN